MKIEQFAQLLDNFLTENIPKVSKELEGNLIIYKDSDFNQIGLAKEMKDTHFISVYHGLFFVGIFDFKVAWVRLKESIPFETTHELTLE